MGLNHNTVDLSNVKPYPEGEGWVRGKSKYGKKPIYIPSSTFSLRVKGVLILKSQELKGGNSFERMVSGEKTPIAEGAQGLPCVSVCIFPAASASRQH